MRAKRSAAAIALLCLLTACGGGGDENTAAVPRALDFTVINSTGENQIRTQRFATAKTDAEWQTVWADYNGQNAPAKPVVDFQTRMVVAVFVGAKPNGCFTSEIRRVIQEASYIRVEYTDGIPPGFMAAGLSCTTGIVYPFAVASIPRSDLPVSFLKVDQ